MMEIWGDDWTGRSSHHENNCRVDEESSRSGGYIENLQVSIAACL